MENLDSILGGGAAAITLSAAVLLGVRYIITAELSRFKTVLMRELNGTYIRHEVQDSNERRLKAIERRAVV